MLGLADRCSNRSNAHYASLALDSSKATIPYEIIDLTRNRKQQQEEEGQWINRSRSMSMSCEVQENINVELGREKDELT